MLSTKPGGTLAAIPRSTSHTSPRSGAVIQHLAPVESQEWLTGTDQEFFIRNRIKSEWT